MPLTGRKLPDLVRRGGAGRPLPPRSLVRRSAASRSSRVSENGRSSDDSPLPSPKKLVPIHEKHRIVDLLAVRGSPHLGTDQWNQNSTVRSRFLEQTAYRL